MAKLSKFRTRSLTATINTRRPPINTVVNFTQCIDDYCTFYYDGNGNFYVQSREPSGNIHTARSDCGGELQGDILRYSFTRSGYSTTTGSLYMTGRNGTTTYSFSNWAVGTANGPHRLGVTDGAGGAATYSFSLTVNVTA